LSTINQTITGRQSRQVRFKCGFIRELKPVEGEFKY
jgi:hypothetical protein